MKRDRTLVLVQMSMGDYRDSFVKTLLETLPDNVKPRFYIGDHYFGKTTKTSAYIKGLPCRRRPFNLMIGNAFGWQFFNIFPAIMADACVLELNPRLAHTWLILLARKLIGKPTVLWGHVWSRSGPDNKTEALRAVLRNLGDRLLFYTEQQRQQQLEKLGKSSDSRLFVAANSLYNRESIYADKPAGRSFVYVGRLVPEKKPLVLVQAFIEAAPNLPDDVQLHMVGAGPEADEMYGAIEAAGLTHRVMMHGHIGDYQQLRALYAKSLFSVSPGYVGLSAIQSLSYGRPILVSRDEPHAPELTALEESVNSVFFETDNRQALAQSMITLTDEADTWESRFDEISADCARSYSIETMVEGFVDATSA